MGSRQSDGVLALIACRASLALTLRSAMAALLCLAASIAYGHRLSPAYFGLAETASGEYAAQWKVSISGGLADALTPRLPEGCVVAGPVRLYVLDDVQAANDIRLQHASVTCVEPLAGGVFAIDGLESTDTDVLLRIDYADASSFTHRLVPSSPSVVIPADPGAFDVIRTYTVLGIEHILAGIDHLLFVLALLLIVRSRRLLIMTITAFTLAHSLTLAAATLGVIRVSPAAVEATIALSILFLATELVRRRGGAVSVGGATSIGSAAQASTVASDPGASLTARFPWIVAFAFGLLHGFGFAGALGEIGLPAQAVPLALLFFNVGVEIGQLLFIAAMLALGFLISAFKREIPAWGPRLAAYVIGSVAAFWVFERAIGAF